jgi:hypothetical protein
MTELAKLADLAKDSSTAGRKSLIATLTEMFLAAGDARGENTAFLFGDIALKLLGDLEEDTPGRACGTGLERPFCAASTHAGIGDRYPCCR